MAVIESKGDGYALYGGVKLPSLPEWDKETYPYAFISKRDDTRTRYFFVVSTMAYRINADDGSVPVASTDGISGVSGNNEPGFTTWKDFTNFAEREEGDGLRVYTPIWSNYDFLNADGTTYLAASDPIPLDGMNVIEWDGDTTGLSSTSGNNYWVVADGVNLDITKNYIRKISTGNVSIAGWSETELFYSGSQVRFYKTGEVEFRAVATAHVELFAYYPIEEEPEEPDGESIGFIEYLVNPKYHMGNPFRGFFSWIMSKNNGSGGSDVAKLLSSDGHTLTDVNGTYLIPKEDE